MMVTTSCNGPSEKPKPQRQVQATVHCSLLAFRLLIDFVRELFFFFLGRKIKHSVICYIIYSHFPTDQNIQILYHTISYFMKPSLQKIVF